MAGCCRHVRNLYLSPLPSPAHSAQVMHDEAVTTWTDQINQMTVGHRFILDNFGVVPTKGWQIDPFGIAQRSIAHCRPLALATLKPLHVSLELTVHHCHHFTGSSAATPTLFARMGKSAATSSKHPSTICHSHSTPKSRCATGFDGTVTNRINYHLKSLWQNTTHLEFPWRAISKGTDSNSTVSARSAARALTCRRCQTRGLRRMRSSCMSWMSMGELGHGTSPPLSPF